MKPIGIYVTGIHQSLIKLPQQIETQEKAVHILWNVLSFRLGKLAWWRHQMEKNRHYWPFVWGDSSITKEFPVQRPVTRSFGVFFDLRLNKWLSKRSWGWWFEMPSRSLWRHYNEIWILSWVALFITNGDLSIIWWMPKCCLWLTYQRFCKGEVHQV